MKLAACGHPIDVWYTPANIVCKACFEAQGFVYNENSYRDLNNASRGSARSGMGTPLAGADDGLAAKKRACAEILNPHLTTYNVKGGTRSPESMEARRAAFALIKERYGINRSTASLYAKEFRVTA